MWQWLLGHVVVIARACGSACCGIKQRLLRKWQWLLWHVAVMINGMLKWLLWHVTVICLVCDLRRMTLIVVACDSDCCDMWQWLLWHVTVIVVACDSDCFGMWQWLLWHVTVIAVACDSDCCGMWQWLFWHVTVIVVACDSDCCGMWQWQLWHGCKTMIVHIWVDCSDSVARWNVIIIKNLSGFFAIYLVQTN